jgi:hypothetical protein
MADRSLHRSRADPLVRGWPPGQPSEVRRKFRHTRVFIAAPLRGRTPSVFPREYRCSLATRPRLSRLVWVTNMGAGMSNQDG